MKIKSEKIKNNEKKYECFIPPQCVSVSNSVHQKQKLFLVEQYMRMLYDNQYNIMTTYDIHDIPDLLENLMFSRVLKPAKYPPAENQNTVNLDCQEHL